MKRLQTLDVSISNGNIKYHFGISTFAVNVLLKLCRVIVANGDFGSLFIHSLCILPFQKHKQNKNKTNKQKQNKTKTKQNKKQKCFGFLFDCLFVCLFVCLFDCLFVGLFVGLFACLF